MNGIADNAVGAILEIPPKTFEDIQKADRAIKQLALTSAEAAGKVNDHWGIVAPNGLQKFIDKIAEAQRALQGINDSNLNLNINTQPLENKLNDVSNASKKTADDVSKTVQTLAWDTLDFTNINRLRESLMGLNTSYEQLEATIKSMQNTRSKLHPDDTMGLSQEITNKIELLKEYIALKKKSEEQLKAKTTVFDQGVLDAQKTILQQILQYQKDINAESLRQDRVTKLGGAVPQEDIDRLEKYKAELNKLTQSYNDMKAKVDEMSAAGQKAFNVADVKHTLAMSREQTAADEKRGQALQMVAKYLSEIKLKSAGISSREEGIYMNNLVSVYQQMIEMKKREGEVQAQVAAQGYAQTSAQTNLLQTIQNEYNRLEASLANVTGKYAEIDNAVKNAFANAKTMQEAENAAKYADALQKAAEAADKKRKAEAKSEQTDLSKDRAEYKRVLALIEQIEKAWRKVNDALANTTLPANLAQQLQSSQTAAEATLNNLYNQKAELEAKRGQELVDIQQQNEAKKGAAAVAEHEKAEKEKTRISRQEATDRYNEDMRQARLQNQSLTAQGKQQRMTINDAREQRAIELAQQRQREIDRLRQEIDKLDRQDANYQKNLDRLNQRINELLGATHQRVNYTREEAMAMAKSASTLREYENAYKALKDAMANTNPKDKKKEWEEMNSQLQKTKTHIDEIKKKMGEFQSQASKTSGLMGQLQGRIAAAFSIGAISGFIKKMVEVRAQFELQRVALGAIIQDRDEANKIFTQVQNMALESPFNIMQLEKATKQIAAFGFETKKLVPTMKMFADISAGLGVEIDRLVLVMGHLKARNFLEGTMVRQFTNMGFNVLGELSKYYSELENKMVSVGEVQDRVKKKMVSFEDVEEVLKRVTSAGGMFYDMQKKQSESLWGQLQRIQDAYDLMLNDIGQSNEGTLKSALAFIRTLINHWRALAPIIQATGAAIVVYFAVSRFSAIAAGVGGAVRAFKNMTTVIWGAKAAQDALNASQKANAWGLLASLIIAATVAIYEYATAQSKLEESLERVRSEGVNNMYDLIFQYRRLADTVRDTNATYDERNKALEEIKRIYKDILPDQMLEIDNIKQMKSGYDEATQAIQAYYAEKIRTQQKETIDENFGKDMTSEITGISDTMADVLIKNRNLVGDASKTAIKAVVRNVLNIVKDEITSGQTEADELHERFMELMASALGVSAEDLSKLTAELKNTQGQVIGFTKVNLENYLLPLDNIFKKIEEKYGEISTVGLAGITLASEQERKAAQDEVDRYSALEKRVNDYKIALQNLREEKEKGNIKGDIMWSEDDGFYAEATNKLGQSALDTFTNAFNSLWYDMDPFDKRFIVTMDDINTAMQSQIDMSVYFEKVNEQTFGSVLANWKNWGKELTDNNYFANFIEKMMEKRRELDLSDEQKQIRNLIKEVGDLNNVDLSKYKWALIDSKDNVASVAKEVKSEVESLKNSIEKYQAATAWGLGAMTAQAWFLGGKTLEEVQQTMNALDELSHRMGNADKSSTGGKSDKELKRWQNLKKAIEDVTTAYDKYRKSFSVEESNKRIEELYGSVFKELNSDIKQFYKDGKYDTEAMIKALEVLKGLTNATTEERKKFRSEIERKIGVSQVEIEVKMSEDAERKLKSGLDEMFANYELSEELKKLGLSVDLVFMLGGEPMDLNDLKAKLRKGFEDAGGEAAPENVVKEYKDRLAKIADIELKQRKERIKEYNKYFVKTVGERAQIELEYIKKMDDVRKMYEFTDAQRQDALRQLTEEKNKKLADQVWKDFKDGEVYQMIFKDLNNVSESALATMRTELERIRNSFKGLSPKDLKEINKAIANIDEQIVNRNPFKSLGKSFKDLSKYAKERRKLEIDFQKAVKRSGALMDEIAKKETQLSQLREKSSLYKVDQINEEIDNLNKQIAELEKDGVTSEEEAKINALKEQIKLLEEKKKKLEEIVALNREEEDSMHSQIKGLESEVSGLNVELGKSNAKAEGAGKALSNGSVKAAAIQAAFRQIKQYAQETVSHIDGIIDGLDRMGVLSDEAKDNWESFKDGFEAMNDIAEGGVNTMTGYMTGDYAQMVKGILQGIKGTINFIASIFEVGDKKKERQIKSLAEKVEALDKAYQKLEKSIEAAYTFSDYNAGFKKMQQSLDAQKQSYEEMIRLEEAKKKSDDDKVKEYKDKLEEIAEAEKELYEKRHEMYGSTNDVWDEANNWVDAWLDAYKETGDGLDALNDSWDEFYENLVKKQAASKVLGARMDSWIKQINDAIDRNMGSEYDYIDLFKQIGEKMKADFDATNADLKKIFEYAGIGGGAGSLILSDLQKGIQNITEPQAAAIEAYLNSMRFAVFEHTRQLDTLIATIQMQYGSGAENPVVTELKGIRSVLDSINSKFDSIIGKNGFQSAIRIVS